MIFDRTLTYHAAQAMHELKATLGIDMQQINFEVRPVPDDTGNYRVVCIIVRIAETQSLEVQLTVLAQRDGAGCNCGQAS